MVKSQGKIDSLKSNIPILMQDDSMAVAGSKIMHKDFLQLLEHQSGILSDATPLDIHQMRVASRRMRSMFVLLDTYYKSKRIAPFVRHLKKLASHLGKVRDLDVMIENLRIYEAEQTEDNIAKIIELLAKRRAKDQKRLAKFLQEPAHTEFVDDFSKLLSKPNKVAANIKPHPVKPYQLRHALPAIIAEPLALVRAYEMVIDEAETKTLHQLRIEFKHLRYLISGFADILGSSAEDFINDLKVIQDYMGELNDLTVAQAYLADLLDNKKYSKDVRTALQEYLTKCAEREQEYVTNFREIWDKFNTRTVQRRLSDALLVLR